MANFRGIELESFFGKLIQEKFMSTYWGFFFKIGARLMRPYYWKTHPIVNFSKWDRLPQNGIVEKLGWVFQLYRMAHDPGNWNFGKFSGWVFQNLSIRAKKLDMVSSKGESCIALLWALWRWVIPRKNVTRDTWPYYL